MTYLADMAKRMDAAERDRAVALARCADATLKVRTSLKRLERCYDQAEAARRAHDRAIADAYRVGVPAAELARILGVSRQRVHRITSAIAAADRLAAIRAAASGEG